MHSAGIGLDPAKWLHQQGMILSGVDTGSVEAVPPLDHEVRRSLLVHHGVTHMENLYLEKLAAEHVYDFLLILRRSVRKGQPARGYLLFLSREHDVAWLFLRPTSPRS